MQIGTRDYVVDPYTCAKVSSLLCIVFLQIGGQLQVQVPHHKVSPLNQLLITLRYYATGTFKLVVGDTFNVHKSTVCRIVHRVTAAIYRVS